MSSSSFFQYQKRYNIPCLINVDVIKCWYGLVLLLRVSHFSNQIFIHAIKKYHLYHNGHAWHKYAKKSSICVTLPLYVLVVKFINLENRPYCENISCKAIDEDT